MYKLVQIEPNNKNDVNELRYTIPLFDSLTKRAFPISCHVVNRGKG